MKHNKIYTILTRNQGETRLTSDIFVEDVSISHIHTILMGYCVGPYNDLCAEQLIQLILNTTYKRDLYVYDNNQAYEYPVAFPRELSSTIEGVDSGSVTVSYGDYIPNNIQEVIHITVDLTSSTVTVDSGVFSGEVFTLLFTDNLSSAMEISSGIFIKIKKPLTEDVHTNIITIKKPFKRDLLAIADRITNSGFVVRELGEVAQDYLARVTLELCKRQDNSL